MMRPLYTILNFCVASLVSTSLLDRSTSQQPLTSAQFSKDADGSLRRDPALQKALDALKEAPSEVMETFEQVMLDLGYFSGNLTWTLPAKEISPRPDGWDFSITSNVLPDHSLRVKQPNGLGVDDVKQVFGLFTL
jgi:hypothetical protein